MILGIAIGFAAALVLWVGVSLMSPREVAPNIRSLNMEDDVEIHDVFTGLTDNDKCVFAKKVRAQSLLMMVRESEMLNEGYHQDWGDSVVHFDGIRCAVPPGWRARVVRAKDLPLQVDILSK
jgi:hypothetical protein